MPKIILASSSPRRKELLSMAGIPFEVRPANVDEGHPQGVPISEVPRWLAAKKAKALLSKLTDDEIVIGADTVVVLNERIYEKPKSCEDAIGMLKDLSGQTHTVITGVCIISTKHEVNFTRSTKVTFNTLSEDEIAFYVERFKPFDKAGSYACQEWIGAVGIKKFDGDYFNVVGLPVNDVYRVLKTDFGFSLPIQ